VDTEETFKLISDIQMKKKGIYKKPISKIDQIRMRIEKDMLKKMDGIEV